MVSSNTSAIGSTDKSEREFRVDSYEKLLSHVVSLPSTVERL